MFKLALTTLTKFAPSQQIDFVRLSVNLAAHSGTNIRPHIVSKLHSTFRHSYHSRYKNTAVVL